MSLLDDARRLLEAGSIDDGHYGEYHSKCIYCGAEPNELPPTIYGYKGHTAQPHKPDCPWLSMSKIVAALEAAEDAQQQLMFLSHPRFREDHLAVLSLADRVRALLQDALP